MAKRTKNNKPQTKNLVEGSEDSVDNAEVDSLLAQELLQEPEEAEAGDGGGDSESETGETEKSDQDKLKELDDKVTALIDSNSQLIQSFRELVNELVTDDDDSEEDEEEDDSEEDEEEDDSEEDEEEDESEDEEDFPDLELDGLYSDDEDEDEEDEEKSESYHQAKKPGGRLNSNSGSLIGILDSGKLFKLDDAIERCYKSKRDQKIKEAEETLLRKTNEIPNLYISDILKNQY